MHQDITELMAFYDRPIGARVRALLGGRIRRQWPNVRGLSVVGLGFATPYLGLFRGEARALAALMPAEQGARAWPADAPSRSVLIEPHMLPLPDSSVDRLLCVHAIESCGNVRQALREIWRVLSPEGRVLVVVPNRRSIWSRSDHTPFGTGEPYSKGQLEGLMSNGMFSVESCGFALALPPLSARPLLRKGESLERLGLAVWPHFAGVIVVEASKQMMAGLPRNGLRVPLRSAAAVLGPRGVRLASRKERAHLPAPGPERRKTA